MLSPGLHQHIKGYLGRVKPVTSHSEISFFKWHSLQRTSPSHPLDSWILFLLSIHQCTCLTTPFQLPFQALIPWNPENPTHPIPEYLVQTQTQSPTIFFQGKGPLRSLLPQKQREEKQIIPYVALYSFYKTQAMSHAKKIICPSKPNLRDRLVFAKVHPPIIWHLSPEQCRTETNTTSKQTYILQRNITLDPYPASDRWKTKRTWISSSAKKQSAPVYLERC